MIKKKGQRFHCVNDLCKRFEGDPSLRLCLALVTPACLAFNHLHVGCELKDGRWNLNMNLYWKSKENSQSCEILVCDHKTILTRMLFA